MKIIAILGLSISLTVSAQTAKVVQLSPLDAEKARSLYEQRDRIDKEISDLEVQIGHQYISNMEPRTGCVNYNQDLDSVPCEKPKGKTFTLQPGWESGFEFSDNFKFIVPKLVESKVTGGGCFGVAEPLRGIYKSPTGHSCIGNICW
jgi:hypothetical protein